MAISVLGVMVAVPAKGAIPSTKYIQEAINNMSTPAGSVITGYGSVDGLQSYLLAGTGTGSAGWLSYSDLVSGLSGYLKGSVITGYADANSGSYILVGSGGTGSAGWMPGSHIASSLGSYIRGYETVTADVSHVLVGSGDDGAAGWRSYENLAAGAVHRFPVTEWVLVQKLYICWRAVILRVVHFLFLYLTWAVELVVTVIIMVMAV